MSLTFHTARTAGVIRFAVTLLAFAVFAVCVTGPTMALADPCETLLTASVPCSNSSSASHATADHIAQAALPIITDQASGLLDLVAIWRVPRPLVAPSPATFVSIPLRA